MCNLSPFLFNFFMSFAISRITRTIDSSQSSIEICLTSFPCLTIPFDLVLVFSNFKLMVYILKYMVQKYMNYSFKILKNSKSSKFDK